MTKIEKSVIDSATIVIAIAFWSYVFWLLKDTVLAAILSLVDFAVILPLQLIFLPSDDLMYAKTLTDYVDVVYWVLFAIFAFGGLLCIMAEMGSAMHCDNDNNKGGV